MGPTRALSDLRTRAREKADMVNSQFVSDAELTRYINLGLRKYYREVVNINAGEFFAEDANLTGMPPFTLPADLYKILNVIHVEGDSRTSLKPIPATQSTFYTLETARDFAAGEMVLEYIPQVTELSLTTDTFQGPDEWDEYVTSFAAARMLAKEESDTAEQRNFMQMALDAIQHASAVRTLGYPRTIADVRTLRNINHYYGHDNGSYCYRIRGAQLILYKGQGDY